MKIWTKFYKADSSRNRELSGSGIGLSLVKAIMNQHHNKYGTENKENGVEFWFELNLANDNK
jgi:signal transduction histidine kinase